MKKRGVCAQNLAPTNNLRIRGIQGLFGREGGSAVTCQSNTVPDADPGAEWFTEADLRTADGWYQRVCRPKAMRVAVKLECEHFPEVLEVGMPRSAQDDVRWIVWRSFVGIWLKDMHQGRTLGPGTIGEALNWIDTLLMNDVAQAVARLPEKLIPNS